MHDVVSCPRCGTNVPVIDVQNDDVPRHPLPIVLTNAEKRRWDERKAALGVRDDRAALLALL